MRHAAISGELRGILAGLDRGIVEATARRLGVSEVALWMPIDEIGPHPAMEVLIAVVRYHGVVPTWLMAGEYDQSTHRAAIEEEATRSRNAPAALIAKQMTPATGTDAVRNGELRLEA